MIANIAIASHTYIVCGYTDMRKSIDGLCAVIKDQLQMICPQAHCFCSVAAMEKGKLLKEKNNLQGQVDYLKKKLFGISSEKRSGKQKVCQERFGMVSTAIL